MARSLRLPPHSGTSAHVCTIYPWQAGSGLTGAGVWLGYQGWSHAPFSFDPWELYRRGVLTNPNLLVIGEIGKGKSTLIKTYVSRQMVFGRRAYILDPKGEYGPFAAAHRMPIVRLAPGGATRLNPLDPGPAGAETDGELARRRAELVGALAETALARPLTPEEAAALTRVVVSLSDGATLSDVVARLIDPSAELAAAMSTTAGELTPAVRDLALALDQLLHGPLAGMFDGPTTVDIDWSAGRGLVLDLSALWGQDRALPIVMTCALSWLRSAISAPGPQRMLVLDEAWALLRELAIGRWLQGSVKLARAWGLSVMFVLHRLSDLQAAGDASSEQVALARGLLADTGTRIIFAQPSDQVAGTKELLSLSSVEAELLPRLDRGFALVRIGERSLLLQHVVDDGERPWLDTDAAMRGDVEVQS